MLASTSWIERPAAGHHVGDYEILPGDRVIGEGRFGVVYAGRRTESSQIMRGGAAGFGPGRDVAIKLVRSGGRYEGIGMQAVREIKLLQEIRCRPHPNVVQVRLRVLSRAGHDAGAEHLPRCRPARAAVCPPHLTAYALAPSFSSHLVTATIPHHSLFRRRVQLHSVEIDEDRIYIVEECCILDLERVIQDRSLPLPLADIKSYLRMLLEGLNHCHKFGIIHRVRSRFLSLSLSARLATPTLFTPAPLARLPLTHAHASTTPTHAGLKTKQLAPLLARSAEAR